MYGIEFQPGWFTIAAGVLSAVMGIAYIFRCGAMVRDFRMGIAGHRWIVLMALVGQGLTLCFIGGLIIVVSIIGSGEAVSRTVLWLCAAMLLILGIWTGSTGGRSEYIVIRLGQFAEVVGAVLLFMGITLR
jgi:hypothetical protein